MRFTAFVACLASAGLLASPVLLAQDEQTLLQQGEAAFKKGDPDLAISTFSHALRLDPKFGDAYRCRGYAYQGKGDTEKALEDYNLAITFNSNHLEDVYDNLGLIYELKKDDKNALSSYNQAIQLDPKKVHALISAAWILATDPDPALRDGKKAVEDATGACDLTQWKDLTMLDTLAAAYAEAGDFDNAVKWETNYRENPNLGSSEMARTKYVLMNYQSQIPYHQPAP